MRHNRAYKVMVLHNNLGIQMLCITRAYFSSSQVIDFLLRIFDLYFNLINEINIGIKQGQWKQQLLWNPDKRHKNFARDIFVATE